MLVEFFIPTVDFIGVVGFELLSLLVLLLFLGISNNLFGVALLIGVESLLWPLLLVVAGAAGLLLLSLDLEPPFICSNALVLKSTRNFFQWFSVFVAK